MFVSLISHSEYLVRSQVWAANDQVLVVQGVKCVLNKACRVLYKCVVCIVQDVQDVQYEFYIKI